MSNFQWAHEEEIDVLVTVDWSAPVTHDMLHGGLVGEDDSAYFYAIIGRFEKQWWPYYIGKVYSQSVSQRQKNKDHLKRLEELKKLSPSTTWHITLGTPKFEYNNISPKIINEIEGLLIYSNWHKESINRSKINTFHSYNHIQITNTGFSEPFYKKTSYGVFVEE